MSEAMRTLLVLQTLSHPGTIVVMHHTGKTCWFLPDETMHESCVLGDLQDGVT